MERLTAKLGELARNLPISLREQDADIEITGLSEDSREIMPGMLFIARPGTVTDGRKYIDLAVSAGARAVLTTPGTPVPPSVAALYAEDVPAITAQFAERYFGNPSRSLRLAAVTGTNGKTTVCYLVRNLLRRAGWKCGLIGTVEVDDGSCPELPASAARSALSQARERYDIGNLTTPPAIALSRILHQMQRNGCEYAVMEASSHALAQQRTAGLDINIAVFTNLSGEHLDYHGSMDDYAGQKARLFAQLSNTGASRGLAVVNADDPYAEVMLRGCNADVLRCTMSEGGHLPSLLPDEVCSAVIDSATLHGTHVAFRGPWGEFEVNLPLLGRHNVMNALQAAAVSYCFGLDSDDLRAGLAVAAPPPGRLERITSTDRPFAVVVDYAHTDDALHKALAAMQPLVTERGRLRVVFGCGGDRDRCKRPRMARAAIQLADEVIITSDNPRHEDPHRIIADIMEGVDDSGRTGVTCIVDRHEAIAEAIRRVQPGDIVVIAGKGHEDYQIVGDEVRPFDDRSVALEELAAIEEGQQDFEVMPQADSQLRVSHKQCSTDPSLSSPFDPELFRSTIDGRWIKRPVSGSSPHASPAPSLPVGIDTRSDLTGKAFFAIHGERFDGHDFLDDAVRGGAALLVVHRESSHSPANNLPDHVGMILVDDTRRALGRLAAAHRRTLTGTTVIAVTGSAGKTTTKHLIHEVLCTTFTGTCAPKSFNNDIGVPLTLLGTSAADRYVVVEVGTNHPGEIPALAEIVKPDIAVITNIGHAHLEAFGTLKAIATEKASLLLHLPESGLAVINSDCAELDPFVSSAPDVVRYGTDPRADVILTAHGRDADGSWFEFSRGHGGQGDSRRRFPLSLPGRHNAMNALAATIVARHLGVPDDRIADALARVRPLAMRMEVQDIDGVTVYNDCYNANPESMRASIRTFCEQADPDRRRVAILGDMLELGHKAPALHREVLCELTGDSGGVGRHVDLLVLVGPYTAAAARTVEFSDMLQRVIHDCFDDQVMAEIASLLSRGDQVLLKASRLIELERVTDELRARLESEVSPTTH